MSENQEIYQASRDIPRALAPSDSRLADHGIDWWALLTNPEFREHPYPEPKRIQALARIHWDPVTGIYFILGHREFHVMLRTTDMGRDIRHWTNSWNSPTNRERDPETYELFREFQPQMINVNAPDHRRMRGVYQKA